MLGAVPSSYDVTPHFQPVIAEAQAATRGAEKPDARTSDEATSPGRKTAGSPAGSAAKACRLPGPQSRLAGLFLRRCGHRLVAFGCASPIAKFLCPLSRGSLALFGRELFTPYVNPANQALNDFLLMCEGEFNPRNSNRSPCATQRPSGSHRRIAITMPVQWAASKWPMSRPLTRSRMPGHRAMTTIPMGRLRAGQAPPESHACRGLLPPPSSGATSPTWIVLSSTLSKTISALGKALKPSLPIASPTGRYIADRHRVFWRA